LQRWGKLVLLYSVREENGRGCLFRKTFLGPYISDLLNTELHRSSNPNWNQQLQLIEPIVQTFYEYEYHDKEHSRI